jgi:hypothetical protein
MRFVASIIVAVACMPWTADYATAQAVKGNEAIKVTASGRSVETPPVPHSLGKPCRADAKCYAGAWRMVETEQGLLECTEPYAREGTCRPSTYGSQKLPRVWVVKKSSTWVQCQYPDLASKCVVLFARPPANLPVDAVQ